MSVSRQCSRAACPRPAARTLTYVYSDSTVVLGPLATYAEPHAYDLCDDHAARLTAPRGWDVVRLAADQPAPATHDDLVALTEVVRRRLEADLDPAGFAARFADAEAELTQRLAAAREAVRRVALDERTLRTIARVCAGFDVDGMHDDEVAVRSVSGWRRRADEPGGGGITGEADRGVG